MSKLDYQKVWDGVKSENEAIAPYAAISKDISKREAAKLIMLVGSICLEHEDDATWFEVIQHLLCDLAAFSGGCVPTRRDALMMMAGYTAGHFDNELTYEGRDDMKKAIEEANEVLSKLNDHEG